jgi:hypothetical protein
LVFLVSIFLGKEHRTLNFLWGVLITLFFLLFRILTIGPSFKIVASAVASLDAPVDMKICINYNINQTSFTFPEQSEHKLAEEGSFTIGDTRTPIAMFLY